MRIPESIMRYEDNYKENIINEVVEMFDINEEKAEDLIWKALASKPAKNVILSRLNKFME